MVSYHSYLFQYVVPATTIFFYVVILYFIVILLDQTCSWIYLSFYLMHCLIILILYYPFSLGMQRDWTEMKQNKPHIPCNK